jgi:hypothetical protein
MQPSLSGGVVMYVVSLAEQAAAQRRWPARQDGAGGCLVEVQVGGTRTQVVNIAAGRDADNEVVAFLWSKAGETTAVRDPWQLLALNAQLTYGRVAWRGNDIVVLHGLLDRAATVDEVAKAIFCVAKAADDLERQTYGEYTDVL